MISPSSPTAASSATERAPIRTTLTCWLMPALPAEPGFRDGVLVDREGVDLGAAVVIDEQLRPECLVQLPQQSVGHRRAGKAELAHARHVGCRKRLVVNEIVIEGSATR